MALKEKFDEIYKKVRVTKGGLEFKIVQVPMQRRANIKEVIDEIGDPVSLNKYKSEGANIKSYEPFKPDKQL